MAQVDVDTTALRCFLAVAEELNFTRAAERVGMTQPGLSKRIRALEASVGAEVFVRDSRSARLSGAGLVLLPVAEQLLRHWQEGVARLRRADAEAAGVLRVGFQASGAGALTARARAEFVRRHPEVTVQPHRFDWGQEVAAVRDGAVDVAFVWLPADWTASTLRWSSSSPASSGSPPVTAWASGTS